MRQRPVFANRRYDVVAALVLQQQSARRQDSAELTSTDIQRNNCSHGYLHATTRSMSNSDAATQARKLESALKPHLCEFRALVRTQLDELLSQQGDKLSGQRARNGTQAGRASRWRAESALWCRCRPHCARHGVQQGH